MIPPVIPPVIPPTIRLTAAALLLAPGVAAAQIAPECEGVLPADGYDEQIQQDFLQNYVALATTFSPMHGPVAYEPGHGSIGVGLDGIPPLNCQRRLVLNGTKTEDTNKTPVAPRLRAHFAFPKLGGITPFAGVGYMPPVTAFGTRNVLLSGEIGAGAQMGDHFQVGGRFHATSFKTVGDVATAFNEDDPPVDDLFLANTMGLDAMFGWKLESMTPYATAGFLDASTFFLVGDDGVVANNYHPYAGFAGALGVQGFVKRLTWSAELYAAPGGYSNPDPDHGVLLDGRSAGHITTLRLAAGLAL
jgi:hypothetical protein